MFIGYSQISKKRNQKDWGIASDAESSWSFGNELARNVVVFGVDSSSSSHTNNQNNNFLVLGEGPMDGINDRTGAVEK